MGGPRLARSSDYESTGTWWVLDEQGLRIGSVRRRYGAGRSWRFEPYTALGVSAGPPCMTLRRAAAQVVAAQQRIEQERQQERGW